MQAPDGAAAPVVSLVVATLGREAELRRLCQSLDAQTWRDFELIVVDQNSDARAARAIAGTLPADRVTVRRVDGRGAAWARNIGLGLARGAWVGFPDDDCWYEPDTLAHLATVIAAPDAPDAVIGHWRELGPAPAAAVIDARAWARLRGPPASMITQFHRRACLLAAGGFDERLGPPAYHAGSEETDLLLRVLRAGARVRVCPALRVHHAVFRPEAGTPAQAYRRVLGRARGTGALYAKHALAPAVVARGLALPWARALANALRPAAAARELALGVGRAQGWWHWRRRHGRQRALPE